MADEKQLEILRQGVEVWNKWREENSEIIPDLRGADLSGAKLSGANLYDAKLRGAILIEADLSNADFREADLRKADLKKAILREANLREADLTKANLYKTDLSSTILILAVLSGADLDGAILQDDKKIGPELVNVNWKDVNLLVTDWSQMKILGDEKEADDELFRIEDRKKTDYERAEHYNLAARAYRQLSVALRAQGLSDEPNNFAYRNQICYRKYLWYSHHYGKWFASKCMSLVTGYGYRLRNAFITYLVFISIFACIYLFSLDKIPRKLEWWEAIVEVVVGSINAFHGRSVSTELSQAIGQNWGFLLVSGIEAILGLILEVALIATLTRRLFSN